MSMQNKPGGKTGDQETDDILAEMKEDGEDLPFVPAESDDSKGADEGEEEEEESDEEEEDDESDESEDDDKDESDKKDAKSKDEEEDEDESDESDKDGKDAKDDDEDEGEEDDDGESHKPVWMRLRDEKKKRKAAEALVADLSKSKNELDMTKRFDEYSKKHGLKPEAVKDLVEIVASLAAAQVGLNPVQKKEIDAVLKQSKEQKFWSRQDKEFVKDFESNILPLAKRDGADVAKVRKTLHTLAFAPENAKQSLVGIYLKQFGAAAKPGQKITSESGRTLRGGTAKEPSDMTQEDIDAMSDEEFDTFSEGLGKAHKSKIIRH